MHVAMSRRMTARFGVRFLSGVCAVAMAMFAAPAVRAQTAAASEAERAAASIPSSEKVRGGMFDASDPPRLVRFMARAGYVAELSTDAAGDPLIRGRLSRSEYQIQFYECDGNRFCNSIQFVCEGPPVAAPDLAALNLFNARWRYVRATHAGGRLRLQMDVNLDAGVTADNFEDTLDIWRRLLEVFERDVLNFPPA